MIGTDAVFVNCKRIVIFFYMAALTLKHVIIWIDGIVCNSRLRPVVRVAGCDIRPYLIKVCCRYIF